MDTEHIDFITVSKKNALFDHTDPREGLRLIKDTIPCTIIYHYFIEISHQVDNATHYKIVSHRVRAADSKILSSSSLHLIFFDVTEDELTELVDSLIELFGGQVTKQYTPESNWGISVRVVNYDKDPFNELENSSIETITMTVETLC